MSATENSMPSPTRGGMTTPKSTIAPPTARIVSVCPSPQSAPVHAAARTERWRLTIVVTAMTWSASVA